MPFSPKSARRLAIALLLLFPAASAAQGGMRVGPEIGFKGGGGLGVGVQVTAPLGSTLGFETGVMSRLEGGGSFDYHFPDDRSVAGITASYSFWELSGRLTMPFDTDRSAVPYAGLAVGIASISTDIQPGAVSTSDSSAGVALLGGVRFDQSSLPFFVELRLSSLRVERGSDRSSGISIAGGLLFGDGA